MHPLESQALAALATAQALHPLAILAGADPAALAEACALAELLRARADALNGEVAELGHPAEDRTAPAWAVACALARDLPSAGVDVDAAARAAVLAGLVAGLLREALAMVRSSPDVG